VKIGYRFASRRPARPRRAERRPLRVRHCNIKKYISESLLVK